MSALKPIHMDDDFNMSSGKYWTCPKCREELIIFDPYRGMIMCNYCPNCGQAIDWSDIVDVDS